MLNRLRSAKLLAEICERLATPGIVREILAGAYRPQRLGLIAPNDTLTACPTSA